jgi:ABC-type transporter Mla MlaB component
MVTTDVRGRPVRPTGEKTPVLLYSIKESCSSDLSIQKTLHVEGRVVSSRKSNLHSVLLDALMSSDHLVVNLEKVTEFDGSFLLLLCSLHQTAQHICKLLTIRVNEAFSCEHEKSLCPRSMNCLLEHCFLREGAYETVPEKAENM